ncbi:MAG: hypothetical protein A2075_16115 [Geobacteraceae bacterium GWC2_58_44]|nr:MAG: hypothetical protein A2075_16115 [Geobacteraceae bacterium GWC2_58_44]HBG07859.1 hypothetical protein [Geobacter sp.]
MRRLLFILCAVLIHSYLLYTPQAFAAQALIPETGQTTSYAAGDDGALRPGVAWDAAGRFTPKGNGTVADNLTGLVWLQNANCTDTVGGIAKPNGYLPWASALTWSNNLASGKCGLIDGSSSGDWRLPNVEELESLVDLRRLFPALPAGHPFGAVHAGYFWSSSSYAYNTSYAWSVYMDGGVVYVDNKTNGNFYVWPVRGGQSGALGDSGISFSFIPAQTVNIPFEVTVSAKDVFGNPDTRFNGEVVLSASIGEVTPFSVYLSNGTATLPLKMDSQSNYVAIRGSGGGKKGESNPFAVSGSDSGSAYLGGVVKDLSDAPVSGATVTLDNGTIKTPYVTASDGKYSFSNFEPGRYTVKADDALGILSSGQVSVDLSNGQTVDRDLKIMGSMCNTERLTPVLLVPGIMGSSTGWGGIYPTLPQSAPDWDYSGWSKASWGLHDPRDIAGWRNLVTELESAGYERGCTVFPVPYDWRMDLDDAAQKYLKPWIDEAKRIAGTEKVSIIAHSMGGLVARSYIQNSPARNDIEKFAMVGTPNHGAAPAYYLYAGGEPETADKVSLLNSYPSESFKNWIAKFYQRTSELMLTTYKTPALPGLYRLQMYNLAQKHIPSAKQLLPTYDFLVPNGSLSCEKNQWLTDLNNAESKDLMGKEDDTHGKIKTKIFAGKDYYTVNNMMVGPRMCSLAKYYKDGSPFSSFFDSIGSVPGGDGTVLSGSASLGNLVSFTDDKKSQHAGLIETYKRDLVVFVKGVAVSTSSQKALSKMTALLSLPGTNDNELAVSVMGRVQTCIVDSLGRKSGIDPATNLLVDEIPQGVIAVDLKGGNITVGNAVDGTYTLYLKDAYQEDYTVSISYMDGMDTVYKRNVGFNHANTTSFAFTVSSGNTEKITIIGLPDAPSSLQADAVGTTSLTTRLSWTASTTPGITGYNVYARVVDEPTLSIIGTTVGATFAIDHPWALDSTVKARVYAVSATKTDGTESFLSGMVTNDDRDHDGLTDAEEAALGTDPTKADTDGDGYNDAQEVQRNSNPLDKLSFPQSLLTALLSGTGKGTVVNAQAGMACSADCSAPVALNTTFSLQANPAEYSFFSGWSGACSGSGNCSVLMDNDKTVTATFNQDTAHAVRWDVPTISYFSTLSEAYAQASSPVTIKAWGTEFSGDVTFGANKAIKIRGGYNGGYTANSGKTVLRGAVRIRNGSVRVENLTVR